MTQEDPKGALNEPPPPPPAESIDEAVREPEATRPAVNYKRVMLAGGGIVLMLFLAVYPLTCSRTRPINERVQERASPSLGGEPREDAIDHLYNRRRLGEVFNGPIEAEEVSEGAEGEVEEEEPPPTLRDRLFEQGLVADTDVFSGQGRVEELRREGSPRERRIEDAFDRVEGALAQYEARGAQPALAQESSAQAREGRLQQVDFKGSQQTVLPSGTVIPARLLTEINSDRPGTVLAVVDRDVLDKDFRDVVLPAGAKLIARYDSNLEVGDNSVVVRWHEVVYPDGRSWRLRELPGHRLSGAAGLRDRVDHHTWQIFGQAALLGVVSAAFDVGRIETSADVRLDSGSRASNAVVSELEEAAGRILDRAADRAPTVRIRQGIKFYVLVNAAHEFPIWSTEK